MSLCILSKTEAGRGRRGQLSWSQLCCSGWESSWEKELNNGHQWLLWIFTPSSALLWNTLILPHWQPTYNAGRGVSKASLTTAAQWQRQLVYHVEVNYLLLWPTRCLQLFLQYSIWQTAIWTVLIGSSFKRKLFVVSSVDYPKKPLHCFWKCFAFTFSVLWLAKSAIHRSRRMYLWNHHGLMPYRIKCESFICILIQLLL